MASTQPAEPTALYLRFRGRVTGPFDFAALQAMGQSGRLTRFHEVSADATHWTRCPQWPQPLIPLWPHMRSQAPSEPDAHARQQAESQAASNPVIESAAQPGNRPPVRLVKRPQSAESEATTQLASNPPAAANQAPATPDTDDSESNGWYYALNGRRVGPLPGPQLTRLFEAGQLGSQTLVWRLGMAQWEPARRHFESAGPVPESGGGGRGTLIAMVAMLGIMAAALIVAVLILVTGGRGMPGLDANAGNRAAANPPATATPPNEGSAAAADDADADADKADNASNAGPPANAASSSEAGSDADPLAITDPRDEQALAQAVGFVVTGARIRTPDGRIVEGPRRLFNPDDPIFSLVSVPTTPEHPNGVDLQQSRFDEIPPDATIPALYFHLPGIDLPFTSAGSGTCFAVSPEGYLLTNRHVIEDTWEDTLDPTLDQKVNERFNLDYQPRIWVFFSGQKYTADIVHVSPKYDLAVLKIDRDPAPYLRLSHRPTLPRGTEVYTLGFPGIVTNTSLSEVETARREDRQRRLHDDIRDMFGPKAFAYVQADGIVSQLAREADGVQWINHTAAIRQGNSGGPLIHAETAAVVGINTAYVSRSGTREQAQMSFAAAPLRAELVPYPEIRWTGE